MLPDSDANGLAAAGAGAAAEAGAGAALSDANGLAAPAALPAVEPKGLAAAAAGAGAGAGVLASAANGLAAPAADPPPRLANGFAMCDYEARVTYSQTVACTEPPNLMCGWAQASGGFDMASRALWRVDLVRRKVFLFYHYIQPAR